MDAFNGKIGIERESMRIDATGKLSRKKNPFTGRSDITMDFLECQCEMITKPHSTPEDAMHQMYEQTVFVKKALAQLEEPEFLWPFSVPPAISGKDDADIADFGAEHIQKKKYRMHLMEHYRKSMLLLCGTHVNISLPEDLLLRDFADSKSENYPRFREQHYLRVLSGLYEHGWLITVLTAASPLVDSSYLVGNQPNKIFDGESANGNTIFTHDASIRCGRNGYWNTFVPVLSLDSYRDYLNSIQEYVNQGLLYAASELYLPIRLKRDETMNGNEEEPRISHIEIRNVDLNPYEITRLNLLDLKFIYLMIWWLYGQYYGKQDDNSQLRCIENYKEAATYDIEGARIITADLSEKPLIDEGLEILDWMQRYFVESGKADQDDIRQVLAFQREKLLYPNKRYAATILNDFGDGLLTKGLHYLETVDDN